MEEAPRPIGTAELYEASTWFAKALRSGVLPVFVATCAVEALLLLALPGPTAEIVAPMFEDPAWGILNSPINTAWLGLAVLLFVVIDLVRTGLYSPLRRVVLDDVQLTAQEAAHDAARRMIPIFLVQQLIGIIIAGATFVFVLLGVQIALIPYALVSFTLTPAVYLVAAHDRKIVNAISDAVAITRRNLFAVFSVQGALLILAIWLGEFIQQVASLSFDVPFATAWAVIGVVLIYRFASFWAMSTLYLALDRAGHCDS